MCYFLCYCYRMKLTETDSNKNTLRIDAQSTREPVKYQKVYDGRKRRIRGLWKRGGAFYAQLSLPNEDGIRKVRRVKLDGAAVAAATDEMRRMVIDRNDDQLPAMVRKPKFDDYAQEYIDREYALGRKTHRTLNTESGHINFWKKQFAGTAAEPAAQVEEELLNQAKRLAKEGLTDEELRCAKAKLTGHRKLAQAGQGGNGVRENMRHHGLPPHHLRNRRGEDAGFKTFGRRKSYCR